VGVHGLGREQPYTEDEPAAPASDYMRAKWAAEARALLWAGCCRRVTRLRLGALYGPGHPPLTPLGRDPRLIERLQSGEPVLVPADDIGRIQPWAAADHGRLVASVVEDPDPPELLDVAGDESLTWPEVLSAWASAAEAGPPRLVRTAVDALRAAAPAPIRPFLAELHRPPAVDTTLLHARYPALRPLIRFADGVRAVVDAHWAS